MVSLGVFSSPSVAESSDVPMQTTALPEIEESDLKAAREFLTSIRDDARTGRNPKAVLDLPGTVPVRNGIARARMRSAAKSQG